MLSELLARQAVLAARITGTSVPTALLTAWDTQEVVAKNDKTSRESDETSLDRSSAVTGEAAAQALEAALSTALSALEVGGTGHAADSDSVRAADRSALEQSGRQSAAEAWNAAAALIAENRQVTQNFTTQSVDMARISRFFERDARRWG